MVLVSQKCIPFVQLMWKAATSFAPFLRKLQSGCCFMAQESKKISTASKTTILFLFYNNAKKFAREVSGVVFRFYIAKMVDCVVFLYTPPW